MMLTLERYVATRFDDLEARFKAEVAADDFRLRAILPLLDFSIRPRILDLGCGKGRFARALRDYGADVVGLDGSTAMLAGATSLDRVRGSGRRLPFASRSFDAVVAIEVLEHLPAGSVRDVLAEMARVLRPGGLATVIDKNAGALDAARPWLPSLVVKWVDERRGRWMYPAAAPFREQWFWPSRLKSKLEHDFNSVEVAFLLRPEEAASAVFQRWAGARLFTLWTARKPGGASG
jgi:SAM-dependent methyltransferase